MLLLLLLILELKMGNKAEKLKNKKVEHSKGKSTLKRSLNEFLNGKDSSILVEQIYDPFLFRNLDSKPEITTINSSPASEPLKSDELSEDELEQFAVETGLAKEQIREIYEKFRKIGKAGELNKEQFIQLYSDMRSEPNEKLLPISNYVFELFDKDNSGIFFF